MNKTLFLSLLCIFILFKKSFLQCHNSTLINEKCNGNGFCFNGNCSCYHDNYFGENCEFQKTQFGIFDSCWNSLSRGKEGWNLQFKRMKEMGMSILITQMSSESEYKVIYYDTQLTNSWANGYTVYKDHYQNILEAAQLYEFKIYLGLDADDLFSNNGNWWLFPGSKITDEYLAKQRDRVIDVFNELNQLFSVKYAGVIGGFYLPHEIARFYWQEKEDLLRLRSVFLKPVVDHIHSQNQRIIVSPFYNDELETPHELYNFYIDLLDGIDFDIICVQDSIGNPMKLDVLEYYFKAIKDAIDEKNKNNQHQTQFWVNSILFEGNNPANINRIKEQIKIASRFTETIVSYDYATLTENHNLHTMYGLFEDLKVNYQDYLHFIEELKDQYCLTFNGWNMNDCSLWTCDNETTFSEINGCFHCFDSCFCKDYNIKINICNLKCNSIYSYDFNSCSGGICFEEESCLCADGTINSNCEATNPLIWFIIVLSVGIPFFIVLFGIFLILVLFFTLKKRKYKEEINKEMDKF